MNRNINENDLGDRMATGISYGTSGLVNPGVSTYSSPDVSQHPINFYPVGQNKIDSYTSMRVTGPDQKDIDAVKNKVTPDEVLSGLDYELKRMFYKNKANAKQIVVDNLKKDPKYYSKLNMLNINDEFMNENKSFYKKMMETHSQEVEKTNVSESETKINQSTELKETKRDNIFIKKVSGTPSHRRYFGSFVDFDEVITKGPYVREYILVINGKPLKLMNVDPMGLYFFKSDDNAAYFTGEKESAEIVKNKISNAVTSEKLEEVTEDRYQKIGEEKKKAFEDIFSDIKNKNKILSNRNIDERVINAYKQTEEKLKNKRNHG